MSHSEDSWILPSPQKFSEKTPGSPGMCLDQEEVGLPFTGYLEVWQKPRRAEHWHNKQLVDPKKIFSQQYFWLGKNLSPGS